MVPRSPFPGSIQRVLLYFPPDFFHSFPIPPLHLQSRDEPFIRFSITHTPKARSLCATRTVPKSPHLKVQTPTTLHGPQLRSSGRWAHGGYRRRPPATQHPHTHCLHFQRNPPIRRYTKLQSSDWTSYRHNFLPSPQAVAPSSNPRP